MLDGAAKNDKKIFEDLGQIFSQNGKHLDIYNEKIKLLSVSQRKVAEDIKKSSKSNKNLSQSFFDAAKSADKMTHSSKLGATGMKLLKAAANMAISFAIDLFISDITKPVNEQQDAIDTANRLSDSWKEDNDKLASHKETISNISSEYEKLSLGVDAYGKNVSLTNTEYSRYNELSKQISDMFPNLIKYHTDITGAVTAEKVAVSDLNKEYAKEQQLTLNINKVV